MGRHQPFLNKYVILTLIIIGVWMLCLPRAFQHASPAAGIPHKVHIAFGFHVNLYHSFRGDTNDENGFGQDIRAIRHTIRELDRFNRDGILFHWEKAGAPGARYHIRCSTPHGSEEKSYAATGRTLFVNASDFHRRSTTLLTSPMISRPKFSGPMLPPGFGSTCSEI